MSDGQEKYYDNDSNVGGITKGIQTRLIEMDELEICMSCLAYSLNLTDVNCTKGKPEIDTFLGIVQK